MIMPEILNETVEKDNEIFLSSIPLDMLEEAIKTQFNDPLEYRKNDYVQSFLNKYEYSVNNMYDGDYDDSQYVYDLREDFVSFMEDMFYMYLGIGITDLFESGIDKQHQYIHYIYTFFILNIKKNFTNLICNYINKNKDSLEPELDVKKKDVITLNFKNEIDNDYDVAILSNLSDVIRTILTQDYDVDEFFDYITPKDPSVELDAIRGWFDNFEVTGNFVPNYISMLDSYAISELESKVRNKILKKYPKRNLKKLDLDNQEDDLETVEN